MSLVRLVLPALGGYADDPVEYSCFSILPLTLSDDLCLDLESALELVLEPPHVLAIANRDEVISVHQGDQATLLVLIDVRAVFGLVRLVLVHEGPDLFLEVRGGVARAV